ncbi:MAG: class I SAM-dependent methyltransferase [Pirellulales bacterium]
MSNRRLLCLWLLFAAEFLCVQRGWGQAVAEAPAEAPLPPALTHYKGREIAVTMHYLGADWLTRESREREEECSTMLEVLKLQPGQVVCDLGCGNGFYTLPMAELVGPKGKVLAVDIQQEMLHLLAERAKGEELANVETILGSPVDPRLPEGQLDLVLLVDVYHEFSHPEQMLAAIRKSLKPKGRLVLVEFRGEDRDVPIKPLHKMTKRQIRRELLPNGFKVVEQFDKLPWQHVMFFERTDDAAATAEGEE